MPIWPGIEGCFSISILTSLTLPLAALTAFSKIGVSCLHGPHHSAQKSTSTGWRLDSSMTSLTKVCVVVSLTDASAVAVPAGCNMSLASLYSRPCPHSRPPGLRNWPIWLIKWEENHLNAIGDFTPAPLRELRYAAHGRSPPRTSASRRARWSSSQYSPKDEN